ncbi:MAG: D-alanyl-D-alanine carboxypeptidase/D-alanyl-D-alanine-endopeptidase [Bacteroidales bacterium]|nr:D-alanyl-D-alanine carboxypeptidase/D-alanyl-D-alanine-endopeptidase [Bacteroidales bacterium]
MKSLQKTVILLPLLAIGLKLNAQDNFITNFIKAPFLKHGSVSLAVVDAGTGEQVVAANPEKSLVPASVAKLITSSVALELLGPDYTFRTIAGYSGKIDGKKGTLEGNIIIRGGGDPALGSEHFRDHYGEFIDKWIADIQRLGIKRIEGRVIVDDSYYDYQPVPGKWLWEDAGNYYGAGAFGLSIFDNTYRIYFNTGSADGSVRLIRTEPEGYGKTLVNRLKAEGQNDLGYVFAVPYSSGGWIEGTIPAGKEVFILKASIPDPPKLLAEIVHTKLTSAGIKISGEPSTTRILPDDSLKEMVTVSETVSPPLKDIIRVLNHESINLYAEHLLKETGKVTEGEGTTSAGIKSIGSFLKSAGLDTEGLFLADGSGLSPLNGVSAELLTELLVYMKNKSKCFSEFYSSLPDAGQDGTLKNYFRDEIFINNLKAKTGSMTRVRSFAGYFTASSGREMAFSVLVNNFSGPSKEVISSIENLIKEIMLQY